MSAMSLVRKNELYFSWIINSREMTTIALGSLFKEVVPRKTLNESALKHLFFVHMLIAIVDTIYFCAQWAAVSTQSRLIRVPPQKLELPSATFTTIATCHGNCPSWAGAPLIMRPWVPVTHCLNLIIIIRWQIDFSEICVNYLTFKIEILSKETQESFIYGKCVISKNSQTNFQINHDRWYHILSA